jgi:putative membrane protein
MAKAASGGKAEVELGRLASERGTSDAVKQFAQRIVTDHGKADEELTQLAQRPGIALPSDLDAKHKQLIDRLAKLSGAEFDRAYSRGM